MNSKFFKIILPTIAVIFLVAGYLYLTGKIKLNNEQIEVEKIAETTQENEVTETKTSDWKTYRNEEYGFEFKYPSDISFSEGKGDGELRFWVGYGKFENNGEKAENVGIHVFDNLKDLSTEDFLTYLEENENWRKWSSALQKNGLSAVKIEGRPSIGIETGTPYDITDVYFKNKFFIYKISYDRIIGLDELENTFNQILNTFKFTE